MRTRICLGTLLLLALGVLFALDRFWPGYFVAAAGMAVTAAALSELFAMVRKLEFEPFGAVGIAFGAALVPYFAWCDALGVSVGSHALPAVLVAPFTAAVLVLMVCAATRSRGIDSRQVGNIAVTLFGLVYVALPMALLVRTRFLTEKPGGWHEGWELVVLVIAVTKASDIGAYFTGSWIGRRKLSPRLSPNKTVEGAVGGVLWSVAVAAALAYGMTIHTLIDRGPLVRIGFGAVVAVASQAGDLTESLIKRSARTKDSGTLLPSLGGVLDLIDSFLVAAPVAYFLLAVLAAAG